jgi:hypothetical protein
LVCEDRFATGTDVDRDMDIAAVRRHVRVVGGRDLRRDDNRAKCWKRKRKGRGMDSRSRCSS